MSTAILHARTVFDGSGGPARQDCLIEIGDGRITSITRDVACPRGAYQVEIAAPGFIDLQINGAADVQLNDDPSAEAMARIAEGAARGGAMHILPTFITVAGDGWKDALAAARNAVRNALPGVLGLHLEGPFLSRHRPGVHPANAIRPMSGPDADLLSAADIPLLVTLAPEEQQPGLIARLVRAGVRVFAGHSTATAREIDAAAREGLSGATHLWNAMPPPVAREPGIVSRVMTHPTLCAGIIADGHHVDPINLMLAARMMPGRLFLVSDAMRTFAGTQTGFDLSGTSVRLKDGMLTRPDGTLAGAHLGLDEAVGTMIHLAGVSPAAAIAMASAIPARVMGLENDLGHIRPGHSASLTFLDSGYRSTGGMRSGKFVDR